MKKELHKKSLQLLVEVFENNIETNKKILALIQEIAEEPKEEEQKEDEKRGRGRPKKKSQEMGEEMKDSSSQKDSGEQDGEEFQGESSTSGSGSYQEKSEGNQGGKSTTGMTESEAIQKLVDIMEAANSKMAMKSYSTPAIGSVPMTKTGEPISKVIPATRKATEEEPTPTMVDEKPAENTHIAADKLWCGVCKKYHTRGTHD